MVELWAWRVGMLILAGIPAIIGGGLIWHLVPRWSAVLIWELFVLAVFAWLLVKGGRKSEAIEGQVGQHTAEFEQMTDSLPSMLDSDEDKMEHHTRNAPL